MNKEQKYLSMIGNQNAAKDTPKNQRIYIKCTVEDKARWQQVAGKNFTKWVTETLDDAAKKDH